jgi:hypothetical protein
MGPVCRGNAQHSDLYHKTTTITHVKRFVLLPPMDLALLFPHSIIERRKLVRLLTRQSQLAH